MCTRLLSSSGVVSPLFALTGSLVTERVHVSTDARLCFFLCMCLFLRLKGSGVDSGVLSGVRSESGRYRYGDGTLLLGGGTGTEANL